MSDHKLTNDALENALQKYSDLIKVGEGKKPIKPEVVFYLLDEFLSFKKQYEAIPQIINTFNEEFSQNLKTQIKSFEEKNKELDDKISKIDKKIEAITSYETRVSALETRETQVNKLLDQTTELLEKFKMISDLVQENQENSNALKAISSEITNAIQTTADHQKKIISQIEKFDKMNDGFKSQEKSFMSKEADLNAKLSVVNEKKSEIQAERDEIKKIRDEVNQQILTLKDIHENIASSESKAVTIFTEVKSAQKELTTRIEETSSILAEKEFYQKMNVEIEEKKNDIDSSKKEIELEREYLIQQTSMITQLFEKSQQSLIENKHTYDLLKTAISSISGYVGNLDNIVSEIKQNVTNISREREDYEQLGDRINNQLDEISKQSEGMMKLNVLSTYIHQTIIELKDAEVSLKMILDSANTSLSENKELTNKITAFLSTSTKLIDQVREQVDFSTQTEKHLKNMRSELLDTQFQLKESQTELNKYQDKIDAKQNQLLDLERAVMNKTMEMKMSAKDENLTKTKKA